MKYTMRAGGLYLQERLTARIQGSFAGPDKKIVSADGSLLLQADICTLQHPANREGDVRFREYRLLDAHAKSRAVAWPGYAREEDPDVVGWPICRVPRVDHAVLSMGGQNYLLHMNSSRNYQLKDQTGKVCVQILHRGLEGGWDIQADDAFSPEILCGIFVFCRYIEQENEWLLV
jgi:hypothetical protein